MKYVIAPDNIFQRFVLPGETVDFSDRCTNTAKRLTPEEATEYGVSVLKMTSPPPHDYVTQSRTELAPVLTAGVWVQTWEVAELFPVAADKAAAVVAALVIAKAAFITQAKAEAGILTTQVLKGLGSEYELAEKEAVAYKAAGYPAATTTEPIPRSIQSEVNSKATKGVTITATEACDNILEAATGWRNAQAALRDKRLTVTSAAEVAVDAVAVDVIKAQWMSFMSSMHSQLGVL